MMLPVFGSFFFVHFDRLIDGFIYGLTTILLNDVVRIAINVQEATLSREHRTLQGGGDVQHTAPCSVDGSERMLTAGLTSEISGERPKGPRCVIFSATAHCACAVSHGGSRFLVGKFSENSGV